MNIRYEDFENREIFIINGGLLNLCEALKKIEFIIFTVGVMLMSQRKPVLKFRIFLVTEVQKFLFHCGHTLF